MQRIKDFFKNLFGFFIVVVAIFMWITHFHRDNINMKNQGDRMELNEKSRYLMTVFIHGTIVRYFSPTALLRALKGVKETVPIRISIGILQEIITRR